jgi:hypothetical protein
MYTRALVQLDGSATAEALLHYAEALETGTVPVPSSLLKFVNGEN